MRKEHVENLVLSSTRYIKQKEYWINNLSRNAGKTVILPVEEIERSPENQAGLVKIPINIPADLSGRLMELGFQAELTVYIILLAGVKALLYRYTGNEDIIVLSPVYEPAVSGNTINDFLFVRDIIGNGASFKDLLLQVKQTIMDAYQNQDYPVEKLVEYLVNTSQITDDFVSGSTVCLLKNIHKDGIINDLKPGFAFSFTIEGDRIKGDLFYDAAVYTPHFSEQVSNHLVRLLEIVGNDVNIPILGISFLSESEKRRLVYDFNNNAADFSRQRTIYHFIEKNAREKPDDTAVVFQGERVSYRRLNADANRFAWLLRRRGVEKDQPVAILLERSPLMVASILSVWKAGGAYIPLDTDYPSRRVIDILEDSGAPVLLTQSHHIDFEERYRGAVIILDGDAHGAVARWDSTNPDLEIDMNSLAYIIYTSGSTGKPKGVMVEHIGMMNHLQAKIDDLQLSADSVIAQNASHTFDISVWQFFTALTLGAETVIYPDEVIMDPRTFISRLVEDDVTILEVVPSYLSALLDIVDDLLPVSLTLDYLLVTGEAVKPALVKQWFERLPGIKMVNAYGPTEVSDDITHHIMDKAPAGEYIPIGRPLQNLNIYIVDNKMQLCPVGVRGEICVSGIGVGRGYLKDEEKTRQVFMMDPFREDEQLRLYKTGDLGCWLPDGTIVFFGRKDYQVKIRGFRIELGEIESRLITYAGIKEAVVIDREDDNGTKFLCAYLVMDGEPDVPGIRKHLLETLPDYMVPAHFAALEKLPLTPNGKIDRKNLPAPDIGSPSTMLYITEDVLKQAMLKPAIKREKIDHTEEEPGEKRTLSKEERDRLLYTFNDTGRELPETKMLHRLVEERMEKWSDKTALVFGHEWITYRQLNERANKLARELRAGGVKANIPVGLLLENSIEMIVGILGIMKSGGVFLPVDVEYPVDRKRLMLYESGAGIIVTRGSENDGMVDGYKTVDIDNIDFSPTGGENLEYIDNPRDLAYIVFTSGSTGKPKGSAIRHQSFLNLVYWYVREFGINGDDNILLVTSVSFDLTLKNIFAPLITGGKLCVYTLDYYEPEVVRREIERYRVTVINCTPSMVYPLLEEEKEIRCLSSLRYVFFGGEAMAVRPLAGWIESCYFNAELVNTYGPSECTGVSAAYRITEPTAFYDRSVPIGKPVYNAGVLILGKDFQLLPVGVPGEIFIAGEGVGNGYINDSRMTSEKFVTVPGTGFHTRLYRTGDFGRWLSDGNIEFLGRSDNQVKIRGYRIELGEIENVLLKHVDIKEAVVIVKRHHGDEKCLCAFMVGRKALSAVDVREKLLKKLPLHMIPSYFVQLEKMPLNLNGKVDRNILAVLDVDTTTGYLAPRDEVEEKLAELWSGILELDKNTISIDTNFFEIGGHSLKAVIMAARIHKEFNTVVSLEDIFKTPTIKDIASLINIIDWVGNKEENVAQNMEEITL